MGSCFSWRVYPDLLSLCLSRAGCNDESRLWEMRKLDLAIGRFESAGEDADPKSVDPAGL